MISGLICIGIGAWIGFGLAAVVAIWKERK